MDPITFEDRVAIVTGAGGGLGRTYALELARRGAKVVVNDLGGGVDGSGGSASAAEKVVSEIKQAGGEAVANSDSVSTADGGQALVNLALTEFGGIDIVINNAGILRDKSLANVTVAEIEAVLDVHLRGAFYVSQPAFQVMKEKGYGRFVFTSSNSGLLGNFGQSNYAAAKMGLVGLSKVVALEGQKYRIQSNAIAPVANTRMTAALLGPLGDLVDPEQVTPMVVYLCSEENPHTGEIFSAGGGRYARFFVGVNQGWFAGQKQRPSVEEIRDHLPEIRDIADFRVLGSSTEEIQWLGQLLSDST